MKDWNVVVTVQPGRFQQTRARLESFGTVYRTDYYNVLAMRVDDLFSFLDALREASQLQACVARVLPAMHRFDFQSPESFEAQAKEVVAQWLPELQGASFHVRMHRRGFKQRMSSQDEERILDTFVLESSEKLGNPARIDFEDPDFIIDVETLGQQAGLSLWRREDRRRHPLLSLS